MLFIFCDIRKKYLKSNLLNLFMLTITRSSFFCTISMTVLVREMIVRRERVVLRSCHLFIPLTH